MPEEQTAASSTATQDPALSAISTGDFASYQAAENSREIAERAGTAKPEASPASTEPNSEKAPASEPGTNDKSQQERKPKTGEDRKAELAAEIQDLLTKRAALRAEVDGKPGDKKADPPPAAAAPKPGATDAKEKPPVEPKLEDFPTFAEYQAADRKYTRELVQYETRQTIAADRAAQAASEQNKALETSWGKRVEEAKGEHADFAEVAFSKDTPITPAMDGFILDSEVGPKVLYRLGQNGSAEGKRIAALAPYAAVRALVAIESEILGAGKKETAPAKTKPTAAPAPATDLGSRNADPSDPVMAALNRGDVGEYIRLANARDIRQRRGA